MAPKSAKPAKPAQPAQPKLELVEIPGARFQISSEDPPIDVKYESNGSMTVDLKNSKEAVTLYCFFDLSGHSRTVGHRLTKLELDCRRGNNIVAAWECRTKGDDGQIDLQPNEGQKGDTYTFQFVKPGPADEIIAVSIKVQGSGRFKLVSLKMSLRKSESQWKKYLGRFGPATA